MTVQGIHAEVLALLDDKPTPRHNLLAAFPRSTHPDAVHKAIYELIRCGAVVSTERGLHLTAEQPADEPIQHTRGKATGRKGGRRRQATVGGPIRRLKVPRYNAIGHRHCPVCEEYLPTDEFKFDLRTPDGLYSRCKVCDASIRRQKRALARVA